MTEDQKENQKQEQKYEQTDRINFLSHEGLTGQDLINGNAQEPRGLARRHTLRKAEQLIGDESLASNSHNKEKISTLTHLVWNGFSLLVRDFLLDNPNVDLGFRDKQFNVTALHWAAISGNYLTAYYLVECMLMREQTALLDDRPNSHRTTPLITAASRGHLDIVKLLLGAGANLQARKYDGRTALDWARDNKHTETVAFLEAFQKLEASTQNSSSPALDSKNAPKIKLLTPQQSFLKFGATNPGSTLEEQQKWQAEQEAVCRQKITAEELIAAIKDGNNSALKQIFDAAQKAKNIIDNKDAILPQKNGEAMIANATKILEDMKKIVNYENNKGRTPWRYAVQEDNAEAMILLIQYGADVNALNKYGNSALHWAAYDNNSNAIETLSSPIIQTALKLKGTYLDLEIQSHEGHGHTPLTEAAHYGKLAAITALLAAGANCQTQNKQEKTPLSVAKDYKPTRTEIVTCLREFQAEQAKEFPMAAMEIGYSLAEIWSEMDGRDPARIILGQLEGQFMPTSFLKKVNDERSKKLLALIHTKDIEKYSHDRWENIREAKKRIEGINPNFRDEHGKNVLIYLILNGYLSLTRQILQTAPNLIGLQDSYKSNALHWAAYKGNPAIMRVLLETLKTTEQLSLFINAKNNGGYTPLLAAIKEGNLEAAKLLIAAGADLGTFLKQSGLPADQLGQIENEEGLNQLIASWIAVYKSSFTNTIPPRADLFQKESSKQLLERQRQERNSQELASALKDGDTEEVARLTTPPKPATKNKEVKETKETTPSAPWFGFDPHYKDHNGFTLLHLAAIAGDDKLVVNLIAKHKVDINAKDPDGNTALHLAALHNRRKVVESLLLRDASLIITNNNGQTPLALAKENKQIRTAHLIERFKKPEKRGKPAEKKGEVYLNFAERQQLHEINARFEEMAITPSLLEAAEAGDEKTVREILSKDNSGIEELDDNDYTPLHLAAKNGHLDVTKILIRHGADIDAKDNKGNSLAQLVTGPVKKFYEDEASVILLRSRYLADQLAITQDSRLTHHAELKNEQFTSLVLKKLASTNESKKSKAIAELIKNLKDEKPKSVRETLTRLYGFSAAFAEKDSVAAKVVEGIAASRAEKPEPKESLLAGFARVFKSVPAKSQGKLGEEIADLSFSQIIVDTETPKAIDPAASIN